MTDYDIDWAGTVTAVLEDLKEIRAKLIVCRVPNTEEAERVYGPLSECIEKIATYEKEVYHENH